MKLGVWLREIRANFLLLSAVLVPLGTSIAVYEGFFNFLHFVLAFVGLVTLHISVNVLNEYYDYKSGLDFNTIATPFSGGSKVLVMGLIKPESAYRLGVVCLAFGTAIGIYFLYAVGWLLLPILILGFIAVYFYTTKLARAMLGEVFAGLGLGALPILGAYFVQTGFYSTLALATSLIPGILTHNLLLLNEFPDVEADAKAGRRNFVIALGRRKAAKLYSALTLFAYAWLAFTMVVRIVPVTCLVAFLTLPHALKAVKTALAHHDDLQGLMPALASNVTVTLATPALLALGFMLALV